MLLTKAFGSGAPKGVAAWLLTALVLTWFYCNTIKQGDRAAFTTEPAHCRTCLQLCFSSIALSNSNAQQSPESWGLF